MRIELRTTYFPRITKWHLSRVLTWLNPRDLEGLGSIRVADESHADPEYAKLPPYLKGFLNNGQYVRKKGNHPAQVLLYASDLYFGIPKYLLVSPMARLELASTLAQ